MPYIFHQKVERGRETERPSEESPQCDPDKGNEKSGWRFDVISEQSFWGRISELIRKPTKRPGPSQAQTRSSLL